MALTGLPLRVFEAVAFIDNGRKGLDTDGEEHHGRISYAGGLADALSVFQEAHVAADIRTILLTELSYLQQEFHFCNEADKKTQNSLSSAIQNFEDALRCLKTAEDPASYRMAETTFPHDPKYRVMDFPRDAVHFACASHWTRLQNIERSPGINIKEKAVLQQRAANMKKAQTRYMEKQQQALA